MLNLMILFSVILCLIELTLSQYMNETLIVNLDLTVYRDPLLNITRQSVRAAISTAFTETNTLFKIYDTDQIDTASDVYYFNEDDDFEYQCVLYVYFLIADDYDRAISDGYDLFDIGTLQSFIETFESNLETQLFIETGAPNTNYIENIVINTMKITKMDIDEKIGSILVKYNADLITSTATPTTIQPTSTPTVPIVTEESPLQTIIIYRDIEGNGENENATNYTFDDEAPYWILIVVFLFIGCCIGCCCWYLFIVRLEYDKKFKKWRKERRKEARRREKENQRKQTKKRAEREGNDVDIQMSKKKKTHSMSPRTPTSPPTHTQEEEEEDDEERMERERKKQRYIEYGSDDDSDKADKIFKHRPRKKKRSRKRSAANPDDEDEEDSIDDIVDRKASHRKTIEYSDSSENDMKKPKKRNKNKRTGNVEPDRYDDDGNRILTTKELMKQYKKNRNKPSIDWSYKVGGTKTNDNSIETPRPLPEDGQDDDEYVNDYEYAAVHSHADSASMDAANHPHYRPEPASPSKRHRLDRINERRSNGRNNKRGPPKRHKHQRRKTMDDEQNQYRPAKNTKNKTPQRPGSARYVGKRYSNKNRPRSMSKQKSAGNHRGHSRRSNNSNHDGYDGGHHRRNGGRARGRARNTRNGGRGSNHKSSREYYDDEEDVDEDMDVDEDDDVYQSEEEQHRTRSKYHEHNEEFDSEEESYYE